MSIQIVIAGTDTDIGKTVFAAGLTRALDGVYWKPIQAGLDGESDREIVMRLSGLGRNRTLDEVYRLTTAASPHLAAERDGITIDPAQLSPPAAARPLIIELAGGLLVPLTRSVLQIDVVAAWKRPVILCASTRLGTINHTLLSIEALKRRALPILGVALIGDDNADSRRTICRFGGVKDLGCLPTVTPLTPDTLQIAFANAFDIGSLLGLGASGP